MHTMICLQLQQVAGLSDREEIDVAVAFHFERRRRIG